MLVSLVSHEPDAIALVDLVRPVVSWDKPPTYWSGGRAGWLVVPDEHATSAVRGLKVKGLGSRQAPDVPAIPPTTVLYDRWDGQPIDPHFGIDDQGEFCLRDGDPAPVGGLTETSVT